MQFLQNSTEILKKYFQVLEHVFKPCQGETEVEKAFDSSKISKKITELVTGVFANPQKSIFLQKHYTEGTLRVIEYVMAKMSGKCPAPPYEPDARDRRFKHEDWYTKIQFDFLKQIYLMNTNWLNEMIGQAEDTDIDEKTKRFAGFFIKQIVDALCPTNFLLTNPQALQEGIETNMASLAKGMSNFVADLEKSKEILQITKTDASAFNVGENIACTPGEVVYRDEMMELIYYTPANKKVYDIPLLVVPPWINKYYILDLSQKNSFIKWIVSQGFSVFLVSWVNPKDNLKDKQFEDYAKEGVLTAINFILKTFKKKKVNLLAYCIGGTLTTMLLAYLAKNKKDQIINSTSFLATLIDFTETGDISIFIDEEQIERLENVMEETGYFDGELMNLTFSVLRANDMIWFFVVNNYLMGKEPLPFDLLYWNSQSTRLPAKMHSFYLRNMYLENNLIKPNKLSMDGTFIDLKEINIPCHFIATHKDHIAPWKSVYKATNILTCPCDFTLAGSGHVAGVINPAGSQKYNYWTNKSFPKNPDEWLKNAKETPGSWWPYWGKWLVKHSGKEISVAAQNKIANALSIEKAPGSYVKAK